MRNGWNPAATASGSGASGASCERSRWHAKNSQERTAPLRAVVANGTSQSGIAFLECVKHGSLRNGALDLEHHFAVDVGVPLEM